MGTISLDSIIVTPLSRIVTQGGDVMHAMKHVDSGYAGFGEAYFSWINANAIKAWKKHTRMTMNIIVPVGKVRFVFFLDDNTPFRIEEIGSDHYARLTIPPGIWFGFQGLSESGNLLLNIASIMHDPEEVERQAISGIKYNW